MTKRRHKKDWKEWKGSTCPVTGKIAYSSRKRALTAMNFSRANQRPGSLRTGPTKVYRCEHCGAYHMSSQALPEDGDEGKSG